MKVGNPVQKSPLHWSVPYDVSDAAGNKAATVWRDVIVEEVELEDVSFKVRREFDKEKEEAIRKAVEHALAEERTKASARNTRRSAPKCPECPKCDCPESGGNFNEEMCNAICEAKSTTCAVNDARIVVRGLDFLQGILPSWLLPILVVVTFVFCFLLAIRVLLSFFGEQRPYQSMYETNPEHIQNHVTVYRPMNGGTNTMNGGFTRGYGSEGNYGGNGNYRGTPSDLGRPSTIFNVATGGSAPNSAPPRSSISLGNRSTIFSPPSNGAGAYTPVSGVQPSIADIYEESPLITPNRRGDGVRRRSPFSR